MTSPTTFSLQIYFILRVNHETNIQMQRKIASYIRSMAYYEIGKMEKVARKRRERLLAMKKKMKNDANKKEKVIVKKSQVKFRSYQPENDTVKTKQTERIEAPDITKHIQVHLKTEKTTFRGLH